MFLTSAQAGIEWSASRPGRFTPGERAPGTHWIGGWVDPRSGLHDVEKREFLILLGLELRPVRLPVCSQSLYRPCYPGSYKPLIIKKEIYMLQHDRSYYGDIYFKQFSIS
jgi:hypothetical protein